MFENFKTDNEIRVYLEEKINNIESLDECRLYKEEQLSLKEGIMRFRNLIEWIIRSNSLIEGIKFSLLESLKYAELVGNPFEENLEKKRCSYYIENSVYREIVLWDMFRQCLCTFYNMEYLVNENKSIYIVLKEIEKKKKVDFKNIKNYLNSSKHKVIRNDLRNKFTHSIDPTMMSIFHKEVNGFIKPDIDTSFLTHPFENIQNILDDLQELILFFNIYIEKANKELYSKYALYNIRAILPCGAESKNKGCAHYNFLQEMKGKIYIPCDKKECVKLEIVEERSVCKPKTIFYNRIHSPKEDEKIL